MAVITISRQLGSGAEAIAQKVAEALGYAYIDKELVAAVAQEARSFRILGRSELNLAQDGERCRRIKDIPLRFLEEVQSVLFNIVKEVTGCLPASLHGNVSTRTGEMLMAVTLCEDLEQKLTGRDVSRESG